MHTESDTISQLLADVRRLNDEGHYAAMLGTAQDAAERAAAIDAPGLRLQAVYWAGSARGALGDRRGALERLTQVLAWADDPALQARFTVDVREEVASAHTDWVQHARLLPDIPVARLFEALDAGEAWLRSMDRAGWRAAFLVQRAGLLKAQQRLAEAETVAAEALAVAEQNPWAPGYTLATHRWALADIRRRLGRFAEAGRDFAAVLDDPASGPHDRMAAYRGVAWCAVGIGQGAAAREAAEAAVALAEGLGDDNLVPALTALVAACRAVGDIDAAQAIAERRLAISRTLGSDYRLYFALRDALDAALERGDAAAAFAHLAEAWVLADAFDEAAGTTEKSDDLTGCMSRLAELEAESG